MDNKIKIKLGNIIWTLLYIIIAVIFGFILTLSFILGSINGEIGSIIEVIVFPIVILALLFFAYISISQKIIFDYDNKILIIYKVKKTIIDFKEVKSFEIIDNQYYSRYSSTPRNYLNIQTTNRLIRLNLTYISTRKKKYRIIKKEINKEFSKILDINKTSLADMQRYSFKK